MSAILRPGDRVRVATAFGEGPVQEHAVIGIFTRESDEVPEIEWSRLTDRTYVADLDDGHWAYGCQLSPAVLTAT